MKEEYEVVPGLYYTQEHTWVKVINEHSARIGITDYGQKQLSSIVFIELPSEGAEVTQGRPLVSVETPDALIEINAPISGRVTQINERLKIQHELVNSHPYGAGWFAIIETSALAKELTRLLKHDEYRRLIG